MELYHSDEFKLKANVETVIAFFFNSPNHFKTEVVNIATSL